MSVDVSRTVLAGRNPVREALERGDRAVEKVLLAQGAAGRPVEAIRRAARRAGVPVQVVPAARLDAVVPGVAHQGVVALVAAVPYADFDAMLRAIAPDAEAVRARRPLLVLLDGIQDPHNFGAILRSAVAVGADGVVVPERQMAPLSPAAVKASAGTAGRIPIARVTNLADAALQLKERGYWVAGLDAEGEVSVWEADWARPLALVVGAEGRGLRPRVRAVCDFLVSIPLRGPAESLNASVAAGVALFAAVRAR